jgi:hypothetical protein
MSKMGSNNPFGHMQHKLWPKKRSGVKLVIWLPTTESWESTRSLCVQAACDMPWKSSWRGLQLQFKPHCDRRSTPEVIVPQSCGTTNFGDFGIPRTKSHSNATPAGRCRVYYMGEGGGFSPVRFMVSLMSPKSPTAHPNTRGAQTLC